jgi:hypothetical protein
MKIRPTLWVYKKVLFFRGVAITAVAEITEWLSIAYRYLGPML